MANLNKVMLIGRLTRDPETRTFTNGGKVAKFGFAVSNRKKLPDGTWGEEPVFVDVSAFNRETGRKLADLVEQYMHKGHQFYIEGHLVFEQWEKDGQKQSKLRVVMDDFQFLEPRQDGGAPGEGGQRSQQARKPAAAPAARPAASPPMEPNYDEPAHSGPGGGTEEEIPF